MANRAYLVCGATPDTAGPRPGGEDAEAAGKTFGDAAWLVPAGWLALFNALHVKPHRYEDYRIPSPVALLADARRLFAGRRAQLEWIFRGSAPALDEFEQWLDGLGDGYIKVNCCELYGADPDGFGPDLFAALSWFNSSDPEDFEAFLRVTAAPYDFKRRKVPAGDTHCLVGDVWGRR